MQAISRVFSSCIPSHYQDANNVAAGPATPNKLKSNMNKRFEQLQSLDRQPQICYQFAIHAGRAGNTLSQRAEEQLMGERNYSQRYKDLMGINANSASGVFDSRNITESGLLNFEHPQSGTMTHTAYVHRNGDSLQLVHNNGQTLDVQFPRGPESHGGANIHDISAGSDQNIQNYLQTNGLVFHYSKASEINDRAG